MESDVLQTDGLNCTFHLVYSLFLLLIVSLKLNLFYMVCHKVQSSVIFVIYKTTYTKPLNFLRLPFLPTTPICFNLVTQR